MAENRSGKKMLKRIGAWIVGVTTIAAAWIGAWPQIWNWSTGFDPDYSVTGVSLSAAPTELKDDKAALYFRIKIDNKSDNAGCISDIAVRLVGKSDSETTRWFFPVFFVDMSEFVELSKSGTDTSKSISGAFSPIYLSASSSIESQIAFMHRPLSGRAEDIMRVSDFEPGSYEANVYVAAADASCRNVEAYEPIFDTPIGFELNEALQGFLTAGLLVTPVAEDLDQLREQLITRKAQPANQ